MPIGRRMIATVAILALVGGFLAWLWQFGRLMLFFGLIWYFGGKAIDRAVAVKSGYAKIPQARQLDEMIGKADHSIKNYRDDNNEGVQCEWISEVYFGGRYELVMTVDVRVDRQTSDVSKILGTPRFLLLEIKSVEMSSDGRATVSFAPGTQREFGIAEWERIGDAKGDFSVVGVQIKNAPPIANFEEFAQESHRRARLNSR